MYRTVVTLETEGDVHMDIALLSIVLNQGQVQQQASMSIMKKAMGSAEHQGEELQKLMSTVDVESTQHVALFLSGANGER